MHVLLFVSDIPTPDFPLLLSKVRFWFFLFIEVRAFYNLQLHQLPEVGQQWYHSCHNHLANNWGTQPLEFPVFSGTYLPHLFGFWKLLRMCLVARTAQWVRSYLYGSNRNPAYPNWPPKSVSWSCTLKKKPSTLAISLYSHSYFCNLTEVSVCVYEYSPMQTLIGEYVSQ